MHLVVPPGGSFRETRRIELDARVLTIGRAEACDVRIDVPGVDDEHAKISEAALVAVGNDCAIGDVPLDAGCRRLVIPGDEVQIGSVVLALDGHDPSIPPGLQRPSPRIRVAEGKNFGQELVLSNENEEYVIGRSPKANLVLDDREVSREHIKVVRRGFSVFLFDAASTRGSWLGRSAVYQGSRVEWQRPRMLKLGATVLSLELPEEARQRGPAVQVSAPMAPPVRALPLPPKKKSEAAGSTPPPPFEVNPAPPGGDPIVAYHYEAAAPRVEPAIGSGTPPMGIPGLPGLPPPNMPIMSSDMPPPILPSVPPSAPSPQGPRTAWKKQGPTIGRASGLLLLAIAGIAILGVIFVVFSLME